jgi:hypothetical protein
MMMWVYGIIAEQHAARYGTTYAVRFQFTPTDGDVASLGWQERRPVCLR